MRTIRTSRFTRGQQGASSSSLRKVTRQVKLSQSAPIQSFDGPKSLIVLSSEIAGLKKGIVSIQGSDQQVNDGLFQLASIEALTETTSKLGMKSGNFQHLVGSTGQLVFPTEVNIQHDLSTKDIDFILKDIEKGGFYEIDAHTPDENTLVLSPHVAIEGEYRITVIG